MKLINTHEGIKGSYEINLNDKVVKLLHNIPEHMKDMNLKDRFNQTINDVVYMYGYLLPLNEEHDSKSFATLISKNYSLEEPINKYYYDFLTSI